MTEITRSEELQLEIQECFQEGIEQNRECIIRFIHELLMHGGGLKGRNNLIKNSGNTLTQAGRDEIKGFIDDIITGGCSKARSEAFFRLASSDEKIAEYFGYM